MARLLLAALSFLGLSVSSHATPIPKYCDKSSFPLASCPNASPNYRSILVAVHGWNGSCTTTFGEGEESIFRVLNRDQTHFYDFDCFEYNSLNESLFNNVNALRMRIEDLHHKGYTNVMLVTHSTGGILALYMLTDSLLDHDNKERLDLYDEPILASNGIRVPAVQAWATPVNGLKRHIRIAGNVLTLLGYSPETLPELKPNSEFLTTLRERLRILGEMQTNRLSFKARQRIHDVSITFYHGQGEDLVVREININQARENGWLWPHGRGHLVDTGTGHSHNVSQSGQVGAPRFPGKLMQTEALLRLPFDPRYREVFPTHLSRVSSSLEMRQIQIIQALVFYARHRFADSIYPSITFLQRIMANPTGGARSKKVDEYLVNELLRFFRERTPDKQSVGFLIGFGRNVLRYYDPRGVANVAALGYNEADVVKAMMDMVYFTLSTVLIYLDTQTEAEQELLLSAHNYSSWKEFEKDMHTVLGLFLVAWNHTIQRDAVVYAGQVIDRSTPDSLRASPLLDSLYEFYSENYKYLPQDVKTNVSNAVELAINKDPELRRSLLEKWNSDVAYLGRRMPLWATWNDDEAVARIVDRIHAEDTLRTPEWKFLADVASKGGATGNNLGVARSAQRKLLEYANRGQFLQEQELDYMDILRESGQSAVYPSIGKQLLDDLNHMRSRSYNDETDWMHSGEQLGPNLPNNLPSDLQ